MPVSMFRTSQTDTPRGRVERAREGLILNEQWRYFGFLSSRLIYTESASTQSMSTDGTHLFVNPSRVMAEPDATLRAWIAKAVLSCALLHPYRMGERDAALFNQASEHVCNLLAQDAGLTLPQGAQANRTYRDMTAEQVYSLLLDAKLRQQPPPPPQPPQAPQQPKPGDTAPPPTPPPPSTEPGDQQGQPQPSSAGQNPPQPGIPDPNGQPGDAPGSPSNDQGQPTDDDQVDDFHSPSVRPAPASAASGEPPPQAATDWRIAAEQTAMAARKRGTMPGGTDRLLVAERQATADWREILREFVGRAHEIDYCVAPETRVLRADLTWTTAGEIAVGDRLIGADEAAPTPGHRRLGVAVVEAARTFETDRIAVTTSDDGPPIVVTPEHRFLVLRRDGGLQWVQARRLRAGDEIKVLVRPWDVDKSDSWLAGILDGEGSLTANAPDRAVRSAMNLRVAQASGPVAERASRLLAGLGAATRASVRRQPSGHLGKLEIQDITAWAVADVLRIIGQYRPVRLLPKMLEMIERRYFTLPRSEKRAVVVAVTPAPVGPVVAIQTSMRTLITDGLVSHNCWHRPNRRFVARGLYLPGRIDDGVGELIAFIDTSGSIRQDERAMFAAEVASILDEVRPARVRVVYCDSRVQHVDEFTPNDQFIIGTVNGGGTAFQPAFDYAAERIESGEWEQPVAALYLTDLDGDQPTEPDYPVLWCTSSRVRRVPLFGEHIRLGEAS
jgi:predicted metal-dependent peptidase